MLSIIKSLSLTGIESQIVNVEVNVSKGLPQFTIIGLPDKSVQESRERSTTHIHHKPQTLLSQIHPKPSLTYLKKPLRKDLMIDSHI